MINTKFELEYEQDFLLELKSSNYSVETTYNYERDLTFFERFLQEIGIEFSDIDKRTITEYKAYLRSRGYLEKKDKVVENNTLNIEPLNSRSVNRILSSLRSYLKYLTEFDLPCPISSDAVKLIKMEKKEAQVALLDDLVRLIECPNEYETKEYLKVRNRAMLEMLFSTGMRISELTRLNREQLNEEGRIYIKGKGKKQRFVYLTPRAQHYLDEWLKFRTDKSPALFIPYRGGRNGKKGERISTNYLQEKIAIYRRRLGIVVPTSAHSLRHGFATYLAEEGASPAAIQILLGHESLHTTNRYVHASDKYAQETHKKYHPLAET